MFDVINFECMNDTQFARTPNPWRHGIIKYCFI